MLTFERWFVEANRWLLILLLSAMSVIVFANVIMRYLTDASFTWADEVARYLMIWMTFLGSGLVLRLGGHVAIDNLHQVLSERIARIARATIAVVLILFFAIMLWSSARYMYLTRLQSAPATGISYAYIYSALPAGFLLLIVHMLFVLKGYIGNGAFIESQEISVEAASSI